MRSAGRAAVVVAMGAIAIGCADLVALDAWSGPPDASDAGSSSGGPDPAPACAASAGEGDAGLVTSEIVDCDGAMVQLRSDPNHCGACSRKCLGTTCAEGVCGPHRLAEEAALTVAVLGVSEESVYWSAGEDADFVVRRATLAGDDRVDVVSLGGGTVRVAGLSDSHLFVPQPDAMMVVVPIDGGEPFEVGGIGEGVGAIVARQGEAFYATSGPTSWVRSVRAEPRSAAVDLLTDRPPIPNVALWNDDLFISIQPEGSAAGDGQILAVDVRTREFRLSSWRGRPSGLAVDGTYVYFFDRDAKGWRRLPVTLGGEPEPLATWLGIEDYVASLVVDGEFLYALLTTTIDYGTIVRVPRCGGTPLVVSAPNALGPIFVQDGYVFFADLNGQIQRVAG
jgi:hypothetical protein